MARLVSDHLFCLIKSLNSNEKRNFKIYITGLNHAENKKIILLFNEINLSKHYDEELVLKNLPQIEKKQMPNIKAYLQEKILQSIRLFNSDKLLDLKIRQQIDYAQLLFERRLFKSGKDYLNKAKRLAETNEKLELLLEIIRIEKNIILDTIDNENINLVDATINEIKKINSQITNINLFSSLTLKLDYLYAKTGFVRNEDDYRAVEKFYIENLPFLSEENLSTSEKIYFYSFQISYYSYVQDFSNNLKYAASLLNIFESDNLLITTRTEVYLKALNFLLITNYNLFSYEAFNKTLLQLRAFISDNNTLDSNLKFKSYKYLYLHEINLYYMEGNFSKGTQELFKNKDFIDFLEGLDKHSKLIFYYKIACLYFGSGDYSQTIKWMNKIINESDSELREDLHCFARIINLISHYELDNYDVISYFIVSTYRFLLKKSDVQLFQKYILNFLRRLGRSVDNTQLNIMFKELKSQLLPLQNSRFEKRPFSYFDIISWLESKIEKIPVEEIVQRNFNSRFH